MGGYFPDLLKVWLRASGNAKVTVMLQAYIDESELGGLDIFGVAGYLWDEQGALKFDTAWRAALAEISIAEFKMADYEARKGEFKGWPNERRIAVLQQLHEIIKSTARMGVYSVLDIAAAKSLAGANARRLRAPYITCLRRFIVRVAALLETEGISEPVAYVLDSGRKGVGIILQEFAHLHRDEEYRRRFHLASMTLGDSRTLPHLQAADILAFESVKRAARIWGRENLPPRKSAQNLMLDGWYSGILTDREQLEKLLAVLVLRHAGLEG